eukprot:30950-Pelagococcus_subviridis.AAC.4
MIELNDRIPPSSENARRRRRSPSSLRPVRVVRRRRHPRPRELPFQSADHRRQRVEREAADGGGERRSQKPRHLLSIRERGLDERLPRPQPPDRGRRAHRVPREHLRRGVIPERDAQPREKHASQDRYRREVRRQVFREVVQDRLERQRVLAAVHRGRGVAGHERERDGVRGRHPRVRASFTAVERLRPRLPDALFQNFPVHVRDERAQDAPRRLRARVRHEHRERDEAHDELGALVERAEDAVEKLVHDGRPTTRRVARATRTRRRRRRGGE